MEKVSRGLIGRPYSSRAQEKASLNHEGGAQSTLVTSNRNSIALPSSSNSLIKPGFYQDDECRNGLLGRRTSRVDLNTGPGAGRQ